MTNYNRALADIKNNSAPINSFKLRDKHVTRVYNKKDNVINEVVNEWELDIPKDIRKSVIKRMKTDSNN